MGQLADDRQRPVQGEDVVVTMVADGEIVTTDGALLLLDSQDLLRKTVSAGQRALITGLPRPRARRARFIVYPTTYDELLRIARQKTSHTPRNC